MNTGGVTLTGEIWRAQIENTSSVTLSNTHLLTYSMEQSPS